MKREIAPRLMQLVQAVISTQIQNHTVCQKVAQIMLAICQTSNQMRMVMLSILQS